MPIALPRSDYLILSCEHGGNRVPPRYRKLFSEKFLSTHRGYDPGALAVARDLAAATRAPLFYSTVSRLLVELNRPLGHPQVFSSRSLLLPVKARAKLIERHYRPYWQTIEAEIRSAVRRGRRVVHLSVHSFTPRLRGVRRTTDIGLLFDPRRAAEAALCHTWRARLLENAKGLRVRPNDPYPGAHPSVVASMREKFLPRSYVGIQLELNQKFPRGNARRWRAVRRLLRSSLLEALSEW
jgi:predicted N-formylglutamate amidohydrolase